MDVGCHGGVVAKDHCVAVAMYLTYGGSTFKYEQADMAISFLQNLPPLSRICRHAQDVEVKPLIDFQCSSYLIRIIAIP